MAQITPSFMASGDIRPSRFVTISGDHQVAESNANDKIIGISQQGTRDAPIPSASALAAASGETLKVYGDTQECSLELGVTVTAGMDLKSDADGQGVAITQGATNQEVGATALACGVSGDIVRVQVQLRSEGGTAEES